MHKILSPLALVAVLGMACTNTTPPVTITTVPPSLETRVVADFDAVSPVNTWTFSRGSGNVAVGNLASTAGRNGSSAMQVNFKVQCGNATTPCSAYVSGWTNIEPAVSSVGMTFWTKYPKDQVYSLSVRFTDEAGQTFQNIVPYQMLETSPDGQWQKMLAMFDDPKRTSYGGAGDNVVRGAVKNIELLVGLPYWYRRDFEGAALFDDVELITSVKTSLTLPIAPKLETRDFYKVGKTLFGMNGSVGVNESAWEQQLDLITAAGFDYLRNGLNWYDIEKNGTYDWRLQDKSINEAKAKGLDSLILLAYGHPDHFSGTKKTTTWDPLVPRTPEEIAAYSRWATEVVKRYDAEGMVFEVWNEPDESTFWSLPGPSTAEYGNILKATLDSVKAARPNAKITTGGTLTGFNAIWISEIKASGAAQKADAHGVHPYRDPLKPETAASDYTRTRLHLDAQGDTRPLWDTEWGYATDNRAFGDGDVNSAANQKRQAIFQTRRLIVPYLVGMERTALFNFRDFPVTPGQEALGAFGLYDLQMNPKPAYAAVKKLLTTLKANTFAGMVPNTPVGLHIVKMNGSSPTYIVWNDRKEQAYELNLEQMPTAATDMSGSAIELKKTYSIAEADGPIYLTFPR
jgi:polysaccharide biosynthesis protein PslG